jgi:hypothetical protein
MRSWQESVWAKVRAPNTINHNSITTRTNFIDQNLWKDKRKTGASIACTGLYIFLTDKSNLSGYSLVLPL